MNEQELKDWKDAYIARGSRPSPVTTNSTIQRPLCNDDVVRDSWQSPRDCSIFADSMIELMKRRRK